MNEYNNQYNTIYVEKSTLINCTENISDISKVLKADGKHISDFNLILKENKTHLAVIGGGMSSEREVSFSSSRGIINSLIELGYQVTFVNMGSDIAKVMDMIRPDIVYNALHGTYGEDGCLQGLLKIMRIPYTGPGVLSSAISFSKKISQSILKSHGIKIANHRVLRKSDNITGDPIPRPYVIKPVSQGSSVGIEIIFPEDAFDFKDYNFPYGDIIIERYIKGRELQVAVLNGKAMGVLEIKLLKEKIFYDYQVKYSEGFAEHLCPAPVPKSIYEQALKKAEQACSIFECKSGIIRVEFIYNEREEALYMLELNTHPGMTPLSICPEILYKLHGINYTDLVKQVLESVNLER